jgi:hypothetical protein
MWAKRHDLYARRRLTETLCELGGRHNLFRNEIDLVCSIPPLFATKMVEMKISPRPPARLGQRPLTNPAFRSSSKLPPPGTLTLMIKIPGYMCSMSFLREAIPSLSAVSPSPCQRTRGRGESTFEWAGIKGCCRLGYAKADDASPNMTAARVNNIMKVTIGDMFPWSR